MLGCRSRAEKTSEVTSDARMAPECVKGRHNRNSLQRADSLYFLNSPLGWAILAHGLYRTTDGGSTWVLLNRNESNLQSLIFVDESTGWAYTDEWQTERRSSSVFQTQDGGRSWRKVLEIPTPIYSIDFLDKQVGYVRGRWYPMQMTINGGRTWQEIEGAEEGMKILYFVDERKGWGYGNGLWRTDDCGLSWTEVISSDGFNGELYAGTFVDNSGYLVGSDGQFWRTSNAQTWQQANLPLKMEVLTGVEFISAKEGWISGWIRKGDAIRSGPGAILHTTNGGDSWEVASRWPVGVGSVRFLNSINGLAIDSNGNLMHTNDGGKHWKVNQTASNPWK